MVRAGPHDERGKSDAARLLLAAARERFAVAATDLLLPDQSRLTEWQRLTAASLVARLVTSIEDELRVRLARRFEERKPLHAALSSARVPIALPILERAQALRDPELTALLVRRVEEHRFWQERKRSGGDCLVDLVHDSDPELAAEAIELVIARSRRFDRFEEPTLGRVELPADQQHQLVWLVAAALRHYVVQQHPASGVDEAVQGAATEILAGYDEGESLEAVANRLVRRLHAHARLDGALLAQFIEEGVLPLFLAGLGRLAGLDQNAAWEVLSDPRGRGPALLVRAAGIDRPAAAAIFLTLNARGPLMTGVEGDAAAAQLELYDTMDAQAAQEVLRLWQAPMAYRACVARLSTRNRSASEAA